MNIKLGPFEICTECNEKISNFDSECGNCGRWVTSCYRCDGKEDIQSDGLCVMCKADKWSSNIQWIISKFYIMN